jgi:hypothetical protein
MHQKQGPRETEELAALSYLAFVPGKDGSLMNSIPTGNSPYIIAAWIFPIGHQENGIIGAWGNYGNNNKVTSLQTEGWSQLLQVWWSRGLRTDVGIFKDKWHWQRAASLCATNF